MKVRQWVSCVVVVCAVAGSVSGAGDVFSQLGKSRAEFEQQVAAAFGDGYVPVSEVRGKLKAATPAVRASIVEQVLIAAKTFTASPAFAKAYATYRDERKPQAPEAASAEAMIAQQKKEALDNIAELKKGMAAAPAADRAGWNDMLKEATSQLKMYESAEYKASVKESFAGEQQQYAEQLQEWKTNYPADPKAVVKLRLREFLTESNGVDFNAKLVPQYGKQKFANASYESKSSEWKLCYRAGREPVEKARAFASAWLAELK